MITAPETVTQLEAIATAETELIEAGLARYLGAELGIAAEEFFARCDRFNAACQSLLRLRAGQGIDP